MQREISIDHRMLSGPGMMLVRLMMVATPASALTAATWLNTGRQSGELKLPLLPFALEDIMQPGEQRDIFVFDSALQECIAAAVSRQDDCVGGLLFDESGSCCELALLLEVQDVKRDFVSTWARLRCVGRCVLHSPVKRHKKSGYRVAAVDLYNDASEPESTPLLEELEEQVRDMHAQVATQRLELHAELVGSSGEDDRTSPHIFVGAHNQLPPYGVFVAEDDDDEEAELVYVGQPWERPNALGVCYFHCRDFGDLEDEENGMSLSALCESRRGALMAPGRGVDGADTAAETLADAVGELWETATDEDAQRVLLSFAASATLSATERMHALAMQDTAARLEYALKGLSDQNQYLDEMACARERRG